MGGGWYVVVHACPTYDLWKCIHSPFTCTCSSAVLLSTGLSCAGLLPGKAWLESKHSGVVRHVAVTAVLTPPCLRASNSRTHVQLRDGGQRISSLLSALRLRTLSAPDVVHMLVAAYTSPQPTAEPDQGEPEWQHKLATISLAQHLDHLEFLGSHFASTSSMDRALVPSLQLAAAMPASADEEGALQLRTASELYCCLPEEHAALQRRLQAAGTCFVHHKV